ncbi:MAG TPA: hypothetical protein VHL81_00950 [Gemmatimonadales bacterium]|nr:hypothetical protein [Gemmatimonadales bacterium]
MSDEAPAGPEVQPPSRSGRLPAPAGYEAETRGAIAVGRILTAIHRHLGLMLVVTTFTTTFAFIAFRQPALYRANAVLRLMGDRRVIAPAADPVSPVDDRHVILVNSLVPRVRSRSVIGAVVDSLGLQLRPAPTFSLLQPLMQPSIPLSGVRVDPAAKPDTLRLYFGPDSLAVWHGKDFRREAYGRPIVAAGARFTVPKAPDVAGAVLAIIPRDFAIDQVLAQLAVVPVTGTDALEVRYIDSDPRLAQAVTNQVVHTFYASTINSSQEEARRRRIFLEGQLQESDRQLGQAQEGLTGFRSRGRLANSADKLARQQVDLMNLDARRGELQADRRVFGSLLTRLEASDDSSRAEQLYTLAYSPEIATDPIVGKVFQQLLTYRARLDSLTSGPYQSSSTNPDVLQLRQMVSASQGELTRAVRARMASIKDRLAALQDLRSRSADEIATLPVLQAEEARLGQRVSALADFSNQLRLEYQKARMAEALAAADIEIVDLATLPYLPTGVPWWFKVGLALVFGLVLGTVLSLLLELKNHSIRGTEELEEMLHVRGLGVIPPVMEVIAGEEALALGGTAGASGDPARRPRGLVTDSTVWPSVGAEAFRLLYSSLTQGWGDSTRTILVTSVAPLEGKTMVAANLAVTFAREGARVLLIDCDLRRPRLHKLFRVSRAPGLVDLLRPADPEEQDLRPGDEPRTEHAYSMLPDVARQYEPAAAEPPGAVHNGNRNGNGHRPAANAPGGAQRPASFRNIRETSSPGLWLLPCGTVRRSTAETLKASAMRTLLSELASEFDVIILDTPPALASADAVILAPVANDVMLVVRAAHTDRDAIDRARQQLSDAGGNVIGAVLNDPEGKVAGDGMRYYVYGESAAAE